MADGKARNARRAALGLVLAGAVWLLAVWPPPIWWRDHSPRATAMTRRAAATLGPPTDLAAVAPALLRTVVLAEDARFRAHGGIDLLAVREAIGVPLDAGWWRTAWSAWRQRSRIRGASTITQQLAKNLYLSTDRSALRKLKEAVTALRLDLALSKDRILELYLNVAEWGPDTWGVAQASRHYYGTGPSGLSVRQAAELAATLPHPRTSNPAQRPAAMAQRRDLILARYYGGDVIIPRSFDDDLPAPAQAAPPLRLPPLLDSPVAGLSTDPDTGQSSVLAPPASLPDSQPGR